MCSLLRETPLSATCHGYTYRSQQATTRTFDTLRGATTAGKFCAIVTFHHRITHYSNRYHNRGPCLGKALECCHKRIVDSVTVLIPLGGGYCLDGVLENRGHFCEEALDSTRLRGSPALTESRCAYQVPQRGKGRRNVGGDSPGVGDVAIAC